MNLLIRAFWFTLASLFRKRISPIETTRLRFTVLPNDLDVFMHMNNSRYLSIMDLGRTDLIGRTGVLVKLIRLGYFPIVAASRIKYRKSLNLFNRYDLQTRILYWDDKWFYIEQEFILNGKPVASAWVKACIRGAKGVVPVKEIFALVPFDGVTPEPSEELQQWIELEASKNEQTVKS